MLTMFASKCCKERNYF